MAIMMISLLGCLLAFVCYDLANGNNTVVVLAGVLAVPSIGGLVISMGSAFAMIVYVFWFGRSSNKFYVFPDRPGTIHCHRTSPKLIARGNRGLELIAGLWQEIDIDRLWNRERDLPEHEVAFNGPVFVRVGDGSMYRNEIIGGCPGHSWQIVKWREDDIHIKDADENEIGSTNVSRLLSIVQNFQNFGQFATAVAPAPDPEAPDAPAATAAG